VCLLNLGNTARRQGKLAVAQGYLAEGLACARAINARRSISDGLSYLALVARQQGDLAGALDYVSQCLILDGEFDDQLSLIDDTLLRAYILMDLNDHAAARHDLQRSLQAAQDLGAIPEVLEALIGFARLFVRTDRADRAAEIAGLVDIHPTLTIEMRKSEFDPLLTELQAVLGTEYCAAAQERGRSLNLADVVQELLTQAV
jgi:tetratricopeptide (TPR) repeat protein